MKNSKLRAIKKEDISLRRVVGIPMLPNKRLRKKIQKILLISPPGKITITKEGSRERKMAVPPLGLAYLASSLENEGLKVEILDTLIEGYYQEQINGNTINYGLNDKEIKDKISKSNSDLVGVSCPFSNRSKEAVKICGLAKEAVPDSHVVMGGQHPSGTPELIFDKNIDYILKGESDNTLIHLVKTLNQKEDLRNIEGIVLNNGGTIFENTKRQLPDVNNLPIPAWDLVKLKNYWNIGMSDYETNQKNQKKFITMMSSRGCPHNCFFCTSTLMSCRKYRPRDIEEVVSEIRFYKDKYNLDEVHFWDDNFFMNKKRVKNLLNSLINYFPNIKFQTPSGSEINCLDEEIIELLGKAGFEKVFLAVESASKYTQKKFIDKKVKLNKIPYLVEKIHKAGMISEGSFMVGFPGETKAQIDETFKKATEFGFDRISISIVNPLPGTLLYQICKKENLFYEDFNPNNIRWSNENIKLEGIERGYLSKMRRKVWLSYMKRKINVNQYENEKVSL